MPDHCRGKVRYRSRRVAWRNARRAQTALGGAWNAYRCDECSVGGPVVWHLGHVRWPKERRVA